METLTTTRDRSDHVFDLLSHSTVWSGILNQLPGGKKQYRQQVKDKLKIINSVLHFSTKKKKKRSSINCGCLFL